jgi:hypothetical protein
MRNKLSTDDQFAALTILEYLSGLFTGANKETFTRDDVLVIIDCVRSDPELFDPDVVIAHEIATPGDDTDGQ